MKLGMFRMERHPTEIKDLTFHLNKVVILDDKMKMYFLRRIMIRSNNESNGGLLLG